MTKENQERVRSALTRLRWNLTDPVSQDDVQDARRTLGELAAILGVQGGDTVALPHCGHVIETIEETAAPDGYVVRCCYCGEEQRVRSLRAVRAGHGPFSETVAQPAPMAGACEGRRPAPGEPVLPFSYQIGVALAGGASAHVALTTDERNALEARWSEITFADEGVDPAAFSALLREVGVPLVADASGNLRRDVRATAAAGEVEG